MDRHIWCYTGYILDKDLLKESRVRTPYTDEMLSYIDILVDGPFIIEINYSLICRTSKF